MQTHYCIPKGSEWTICVPWFPLALPGLPLPLRQKLWGNQIAPCVIRGKYYITQGMDGYRCGVKVPTRYFWSARGKNRQHTEQPCGCYVNRAAAWAMANIHKLRRCIKKIYWLLLRAVINDHNQSHVGFDSMDRVLISKCYYANAHPSFFLNPSWKLTAKGLFSKHFGVFALKLISAGSLWVCSIVIISNQLFADLSN